MQILENEKEIEAWLSSKYKLAAEVVQKQYNCFWDARYPEQYSSVYVLKPGLYIVYDEDGNKEGPGLYIFSYTDLRDARYINTRVAGFKLRVSLIELDYEYVLCDTV